MRLKMYGGTDVGLVRSSNQDAHFFSADYGIAIVSDGMGGHQGGEIASELTVTGLRDAFLSSSQILVENVRGFLDDVLGRINTDIRARGAADERLRGMGATVNYLMFAAGQVAIGHAGDSRTYLARGWRRPDGSRSHSLWQLTVDHNVGTFIDRGIFVEGRDYRAGAMNEKLRARLTRGMGVVADLSADLYSRRLQEGDVYLTCSDGLHGFATDTEILRALVMGPLSKAPTRLIELAKSKGAPDNVTMVVTAVGDDDEPLYQPSQASPTRRLFLARSPEGEIVGPQPSHELLKQWFTENLPAHTEICASLDHWVFLNNKKKICERYPEFNVPKWKERLKQINAEQNAVHRSDGYASNGGNRRALFFAIVVFIAILLFAVVLLLPGS